MARGDAAARSRIVDAGVNSSPIPGCLFPVPSQDQTCSTPSSLQVSPTGHVQPPTSNLQPSIPHPSLSALIFTGGKRECCLASSARDLALPPAAPTSPTAPRITISAERGLFPDITHPHRESRDRYGRQSSDQPSRQIRARDWPQLWSMRGGNAGRGMVAAHSPEPDGQERVTHLRARQTLLGHSVSGPPVWALSRPPPAVSPASLLRPAIPQHPDSHQFRPLVLSFPRRRTPPLFLGKLFSAR
ncbi:hypothetical protein ANO11243_009380 [Dothideomycetidae sp. 11243]|nr:hypothetical protein ANO11243_009380 [fungal sp. No.11243]